MRKKRSGRFPKRHSLCRLVVGQDIKEIVVSLPVQTVAIPGHNVLSHWASLCSLLSSAVLNVHGMTKSERAEECLMVFRLLRRIIIKVI